MRYIEICAPCAHSLSFVAAARARALYLSLYFGRTAVRVVAVVVISYYSLGSLSLPSFLPFSSMHAWSDDGSIWGAPLRMRLNLRIYMQGE